MFIWSILLARTNHRPHGPSELFPEIPKRYFQNNGTYKNIKGENLSLFDIHLPGL
jgi:hypothetical protein